MNATGPDLDRSAAGRVALDAMLVPTAFLNPLVSWSDGPRSDSATAEWTVGARTLQTELRVGPDGELRSVVMPRWGNPHGRAWGEYPCGGILADEVDFGGIRLPTQMRAGWFFDTDHWAEGEFFRAQITKATFL